MKQKIPLNIWEEISSFLANRKKSLSDEANEWLKDKSNSKNLNELLYYREAYSRKFHDTGKDEVRRNIIKLVGKRNRSLMMLKYAASIIVILGLSFLTWIMFDNINNREKIADSEPIERYEGKVELILPGGKTVTLSDQLEKSVLKEESVNIVIDTQKLVSYEKLAGNAVDKKDIEPEIHYIRVPKGADYQLVLSDGTKVWLNSESELKYPSFFKGDKRMVELKGEGFFKVTKDPKRRFITKVNNLKIEVLGTSYNISAYAEDKEIKATLISGSIKAVTKENTTILKPDQQLTFSDENKKWEVKEVDVEDYVSWKDGLIQIKAYTFEQIVNMLKRWYDFEIFFMNEDLKKYRFKGVINKNLPLEDILGMIQQTTDIRFKIKGKTVTVFKEYKR
jgi:hypothetical protein